MNIIKLSRLLKRSHRHTKSWNVTGKLFDITSGMAYKIAIDKYEPASDDLRERLGLDHRVCPKCKRKIITRTRKNKPDYIKEWDHLPTVERHKVIRQYLEWKEKQ